MVARLRRLPLLLAVAGSLSACGAEEGLIFEGTPGQPVPLELSDWIPLVQARVDSGASFAALVDTGSPLTAVSPTAHPSGEVGAATVRLDTFGLTFPDLDSVVMTLFPETSVCQQDLPEGLVGGDLVRHFRLGLDYRGKRGFLFHGPGEDPPVGQGVGPTHTVGMAVLGGGHLRLPEGTVGEAVWRPATRIVAQAAVEGAPHAAMVDTGASVTVVTKQLLASLGGSGRPSICCVSVATLYGVVQARLSRLKELRLGSASVKNVPVLVWEDTEFFDMVSTEVGQQVSLLIGGSFLRHFAVLADYPGETLRLGHYGDQSHVDADEYVGPGFTFCKAKTATEGMVVVDVYEGTSAEQQRVSKGQRLLAVDGHDLAGLSVEEVRDLMRVHPKGEAVKLTFWGPIDKDVLIEELLPGYN